MRFRGDDFVFPVGEDVHVVVVHLDSFRDGHEVEPVTRALDCTGIAVEGEPFGKEVEFPLDGRLEGVVGCIRHQRGVTVVKAQRCEVEITVQRGEVVWGRGLGDGDAQFVQPFGRRGDHEDSRTRLFLGVAREREIDVSFAGRGGGRRPVECVPLRVCRFGRPFRILGGYRQQYVEFAVDAVIGYLYRVGGGYGQRRRENPAFLYDANGLAVGGIVRRGDDDGSRPALRVGVVGDRDRKLVACRGDRYPFTGCFVGRRRPCQCFGRGGYGHLLRGSTFALEGQRRRIHRDGHLRRVGIGLLCDGYAACGQFAAVRYLYPDLSCPLFPFVVVGHGYGEYVSFL